MSASFRIVTALPVNIASSRSPSTFSAAPRRCLTTALCWPSSTSPRNTNRYRSVIPDDPSPLREFNHSAPLRKLDIGRGASVIALTLRARAQYGRGSRFSEQALAVNPGGRNAQHRSALRQLVRAAQVHVSHPARRRHLGDAGARGLRPRQRRNHPSIRPRAAYRAADAPVPACRRTSTATRPAC